MLKDQLVKLLEKAESAHTKEQAVYHKLLKEKANVEKKLRVACDRASNTANELASLQKAVADLPPPKVVGKGAAKAQSAQTVN